MYQLTAFSRSIFLLVLFAVFVNVAYAFEAKGSLVEKASNSTVAPNFIQGGIKPKAALANNPPESQLRDLNEDGNLDFVSTNAKLGGILIALGLGNGAFAEPVNYLSGSKPLTIKIRDFNNDKKIDLLAYNFKQKKVSVLLGDANGSFTIQKIYPINPALLTVSPSGQNNLAPPTGAQAAAVSPKAAATAFAMSTITGLEQSVNQKINAYRASRRLPALSLNATISNVARIHSQNMASGKVPFSHQGFDARVRTLSKMFTFRSAGENVAYNQGYKDPVATAVNGWLKSPGHLSNIVGAYNLTGIGVARNSSGKYFFTQIFWRR